ncbi:MAG: CopD family protein [Pseudomonadota bacterium]
MNLLHIGAVLLLNAGFAWLTGSLLARRWHDPGALRRGEVIASAVCLSGTLLAMWAATARMGDLAPLEALLMLPQMLVQTSYGQAGLAATACAALTLLPWRGVIVQALLLALFALARASASHASEHGWFSVAVGVEWLHLMLIGVWLGGVTLAGWVALPTGRHLGWLSQVATWALAGIVASGVFNAWQRLDAPGQLFGTPYGLVLSVKLAFIALAALLGAYNRFAGFPAAACGQGRAASLVLRVESVALLAALASAALLTSMAPPA